MWEKLLLALTLTFSISVFFRVTASPVNQTTGDVYRPSEPALILTHH